MNSDGGVIRVAFKFSSGDKEELIFPNGATIKVRRYHDIHLWKCINLFSSRQLKSLSAYS